VIPEHRPYTNETGTKSPDNAAAYEHTYGVAEPLAELIPAMLAAFLDSDRAFARNKSKA